VAHVKEDLDPGIFFHLLMFTHPNTHHHLQPQQPVRSEEGKQGNRKTVKQ
jgi:hypothetical protein